MFMRVWGLYERSLYVFKRPTPEAQKQPLQLLQLPQNRRHRLGGAVTQLRDHHGDELVRGRVKQQPERLTRVVLRVNLVIRQRVGRHALREVDALAQRHHAQAQIARHRRDVARASAGVHGAVAEHGLGGDEHARRVPQVRPQRAEIVRVHDGNAGRRERRGVGEADALKGVVDEDDAEARAVGAGAQQRALDEVVPRVDDDDVVIGEHGGGGLHNDHVGERDALVNVRVNGGAQLLLGVGVGEVNVDFGDLQLQPADGVTHGEAHGPAGGQVLDLVLEHDGGEVAREGGAMGGCV